MKKTPRPSKIENILAKAKKCIAMGLYRYTAHAEDRQLERMITEEDALYVIETGWRVPVKDDFVELYQSWTYAFEGNTLQDELLRVIIGFDEDMMLIITVMNVSKSSK